MLEDCKAQHPHEATAPSYHCRRTHKQAFWEGKKLSLHNYRTGTTIKKEKRW